MCCLCIQFTHENTSERTILHLVQVWLLALQKRLAKPLTAMLYFDGITIWSFPHAWLITCNMSNMMGITNGARKAYVPKHLSPPPFFLARGCTYPSEIHEFAPGFYKNSSSSIFSFLCIVLQIIVYPLYCLSFFDLQLLIIPPLWCL